MKNSLLILIGICIGAGLVYLFEPKEEPDNLKEKEQVLISDHLMKSPDSIFTLIVEDTTFFYKGKVIGNFQFFNYALTKDEIYKITQPKANKKMMKAMKVGECMIYEGGMVRIYRTKEGWFTIGPGGSEFMSNELIEQMGL